VIDAMIGPGPSPAKAFREGVDCLDGSMRRMAGRARLCRGVMIDAGRPMSSTGGAE
jgi:hypothetical protein